MSAASPARTALALATIVAVAVALLAALHAGTRGRIEAQQRAAATAALAVLLPEGYDNDPLADRVAVPAGDALGLRAPGEAHVARRGAAPLGIVLPVVARDGYAGDIALRVGIRYDGTVVGVRVVSHRETLGLGDPIESHRSDWIHGFAGRSRDDPPRERWTVRGDGGEFDQFAGATITPRAVVHALRRALDYHAARRNALYARHGAPR